MTEDDVERVARAIAVANHEHENELDTLHRDSHGELMPIWTNYKPLARAAITALQPMLDKARAEGREAGLKEAAAVAEKWIEPIMATPHENATYKSIAAAIRDLLYVEIPRIER